MYKRLPRYISTLLLLALPVGATARPAIAVGQVAPDFRLPDQHGQTVTLAGFRGRWLVLYFYPKDFTPGCTTEAQHFRDVVPQIQQLGAAVVGISEDSVKSHARFARVYHLDYTLLADDNGQVAAAYDSLYNILGILKFAKRHTFIISPAGRIAVAFMNVDPARNPGEVVTKLTHLMKISR